MNISMDQLSARLDNALPAPEAAAIDRALAAFAHKFFVREALAHIRTIGTIKIDRNIPFFFFFRGFRFNRRTVVRSTDGSDWSAIC